MRSSSALFPVALSSAEIRGDLSEDVYRLRPGNSPDSSVELALTRLGLVGQASQGVPVILLHGSFSNRRFWFSPKGLGLGAYLARAGFDVWLPEMRGHGLSRVNQCYAGNTVADYARYDLPAIAAFVREQSGQVPHWLGHSMGGTSLAAALGGQYLRQDDVASVALFGSQVSRGHWALKIPPLVWLIRLALLRLNLISGPRWQRGPENEPIGMLFEGLRWHGLFGRFGDREQDWGAGLAQVRVPVLAVAAAGDKQDPAWACRELLEQFGSDRRRFVCLSAAEGFSGDYGHVEMLVSPPAIKEVWPLVELWLREQRVN